MLKDEMRWRDWLWLGIAAVMGLGAILAIVPGYGKIGEWMAKDAAPAWVQAIGSVLAIYTAVWTVSRETKRREKQELRLASLAASAVHRKVTALWAFSSKWTQLFELIASLEVDGSELVPMYTQCLEEATHLVRPTEIELSNLVFAQSRIANRIAHSFSCIELLMAHCRRAHNITSKSIPEQRIFAMEAKGCIIMLPEHTREAVDNLMHLKNAGEQIEHWIL